MPVLIMCNNPECGELFDAPDEAVGRKVRCPSCGMVQTLGKPARKPKPAGHPVELVDADDTAPNTPGDHAAANAAVGRPASATPAPLSGEDNEEFADGPHERHGSFGDTSDMEVFDLQPLGSAEVNKKPAPQSATPAPTDPPPADVKPKPAQPVKAAGPSNAPQAAQPKKTPKAARPPEEDEFELSADTDRRDVSSQSHSGGSTIRLPAQNDVPLQAPPSPVNANIQFSSQLTESELSQDIEAQAHPDPEDISDGILEHKMASAAIFVIGLAGMFLGLLVGAFFFPGQRLLAAYLGAAAGWAAGFIAAFLFVMSTEKNEPDKVRCRVCRNVFPAEMDVCQWCGEPLTGPSMNPLAAGCLRALSYATSNKLMIAWLTILGIFTDVCIYGTYMVNVYFWGDIEPYWPFLLGLCCLIGFGIYSYAMQYFLAAVGATIKRDDKPPAPPAFWSPANIAAGFTSAIVLATYIAPVFTLPLLPMALLMLGSAGFRKAMNVPGVFRLTCSHGKDLAILWLMLLLGLAACAMAAAVIAFFHLLMDFIPVPEGSPGLALRMILSIFKYGLVAVGASIFGLALFRCIGLFGRLNSKTIFPNLQKK